MLRPWDAVIVGSGAGGSVVADRLAAAGARVVVLEEGPRVAVGEVADFSGEQMRRQYRGGGLVGALGRPPIAYAEGRCVGGGTEVNAGLYHRPPVPLLQEWSRTAVPDLDPDAVAELSSEIESDLEIQPRPGGPNRAARVLADGAARVGWSWEDVPRWIGGTGSSQRRSMSTTFGRRAAAAGAVIVPDTRVSRIVLDGGRAVGVQAAGRDGSTTTWHAERVIVSAGAVQTPGLLARSGLPAGRSRSIAMHPMAKVVARFEDPVNEPEEIGTVQVREFAPTLTFGSSASTPAMLGIGLLRTAAGAAGVRENWPHLSSYYVALSPSARGRVVHLPGMREPVVTYRLSSRDKQSLLQGLSRLTHLLLAGDASAATPSAAGAMEVGDAAELVGLRAGSLDLMSVHLTSSVPLGGPLDGWGRVRGVRHLWVADASILPSAPGVNPQGTVMALARRTADAIVSTGGAP